MPYIDPSSRPRLDPDLDGLALPEGAGELNYAITRLVDRYLEASGDVRYAALNEAVGVLECVKLELYRRVAAPYEDEKAAQNGDVYRVITNGGSTP